MLHHYQIQERTYSNTYIVAFAKTYPVLLRLMCSLQSSIVRLILCYIGVNVKREDPSPTLNILQSGYCVGWVQV